MKTPNQKIQGQNIGDSNIHGNSFVHHFAQSQKKPIARSFTGSAHEGRACQRERRGVDFFSRILYICHYFIIFLGSTGYNLHQRMPSLENLHGHITFHYGNKADQY